MGPLNINLLYEVLRALDLLQCIGHTETNYVYIGELIRPTLMLWFLFNFDMSLS